MAINEPLILGFEGTAHTAGVAVVRGNQIIVNEAATYTPVLGGIHPREASDFLAKHFPKLLEQIFEGQSFDQEVREFQHQSAARGDVPHQEIDIRLNLAGRAVGK